MTTVRLRPAAEADLVDRTRYYRREAGDTVAERFFTTAVEVLEAIARAPGVGSPWLGERCGVPGLRVRRINGFPCAWYYFVTNGTVDVVRLLVDTQDLESLLNADDDAGY